MNKIQIDAKRFGYNKDTQELDYLGNTDIMPWEINYTEDYRMAGGSLEKIEKSLKYLVFIIVILL